MPTFDKSRLIGTSLTQRANAGPQPRLEAAARHERRLEGVGCRPMFGWVPGQD
jgi:hypothetical protein